MSSYRQRFYLELFSGEINVPGLFKEVDIELLIFVNFRCQLQTAPNNPNGCLREQSYSPRKSSEKRPKNLRVSPLRIPSPKEETIRGAGQFLLGRFFAFTTIFFGRTAHILKQKYETLQVAAHDTQNTKNFDHFTLLFYRRLQKNVRRFQPHMQGYCFPRKVLSLAAFPLPLPTWFFKVPASEGKGRCGMVSALDSGSSGRV